MASDEQLIRLQDVPDVVCELRPGFKRVHWTTCYRWCTKGCRGVKLWSTPVGWGRMTSATAVREFLAQLDALHGRPESAPETTRQLTREQRTKGDNLAAAGW